MTDDLIARMAQKNMSHVVDTIDASEHPTLGNLIEQSSEDKDTPPAVDTTSVHGKNIDLDADFDRARQNLNELANEGMISLRELNQIAQVSQHPRAFEVVANLIDKLSKVNNEIVELHERKAKAITAAQKNEDDEPQGHTINQTYNDNRTVVQGTTADLVRKYRGKGQDNE